MSDAESLKARRAASRQRQFLDVVTAEEASRRFREALDPAPLGIERMPLDRALNRVLAADVAAQVDVPGFDRANVDGFAVRAEDTVGAREDSPRILRLTDEVLTPGVVPQLPVGPGQASLIATGGMVPRGSDAVVMVEDTESWRSTADRRCRLGGPFRPAPTSPLPARMWDVARPSCVRASC